MLFPFILAALAADTGSPRLAERFAAWKYASEIQARNPTPYDRPAAIIDAELILPADRTANLRNDIRVVEEAGFGALEKEMTFQVYAIRPEGANTVCRVAFAADLPPNGFERFAVFYDNPQAAAPDLPAGVDLRREGGRIEISARRYRLALDAATGQVLRLATKIPADRELTAADEDEGAAAFPLPAVLAHFDGGTRALRFAGPSDGDRITAGPVFTWLRGTRSLAGPAGEALGTVTFDYVFYPNAPHFIVREAVHFAGPAQIERLELSSLAAAQSNFTYFMFRPVTPTFPLTEVEEVGSVLLDPALRLGFGTGDLLAGMLPPDLAWVSLANAPGGYAVTSFQLDRRSGSVGGTAAPTYRASTRARANGRIVAWSNAPIYVAAAERGSAAQPVARGDWYEQTQAIYFSDWDSDEWRARTDAYGRGLNEPPQVVVYPLTRLAGAPEAGAPHYGTRASAYLRGIR